MNIDHLKKTRINLGLSQEEFGHLLGVTGATINRWERGTFKPSKLAMEKIKTILTQKIITT